MQPTGRRAVHAAQKQERRQAIIDAASALFADTPFAALTVSAVAERVGLAKGTVYLYFATKEELFLALAEQQLADWFATLRAQLATAHTPAALVDLFCATLLARPLLVRLLAMLHSDLEQNIGYEVALDFKRFLALEIAQTGAALEVSLTDLPRGTGPLLLIRAQALVIGFTHMSTPSATVRDVLALPEFAPLAVHFDPGFPAAFAALLRGMLAPISESEGL